ncbi:HDOD domain-containing protein [Oleiharenicola lentus]|nr:HDOD domain-containing protein [Oleiharenicola lentus]
MSAALSAFFRGWWVRFFLRPKPAAPTPARVEPLAKTEDAPSVARAVEAEPVAPPAMAPPAMVPSWSRSPVGVTRAPFIPVAQPALRASTLAKLATLQQIPSLQALAQGFLRAAARSDGAIEEVVAAVEKDPALCVRVLRMANSAFVASEQRIEDVATAVQMLGLQRVNTLSHALFMMRDAHNTKGGVDWRHLWMHALATAAIAEEIEKQLGREAGQQLYLAALLHDVGKIVLSTVAPEAYRAIMDKAWSSEGRLDALEAVCFGVGHSEAGVIFAQQSGLPGEVIAAIADHAEPARAEGHRLTVAVVSVANYLAKFYGLGFSGTRLEESDGDLEAQPVWAVIAEETGANPDIAGISSAVEGVVVGLKQDLLSLRDAA